MFVEVFTSDAMKSASRTTVNYVNKNKKMIIVSSASVAVGGGVGAAVAGRNKKEAVRNSHKEGVKQGELIVTEKFKSIIFTQKTRDEFMLLVAKVGSYIGRLDGEFTALERVKISEFIGHVNESPATPEIIKSRITEILESNYTFDEIVDETNNFLSRFSVKRSEYLNFLENVVLEMIDADGEIHDKEKEFYDKWINAISYNG